VRKERYNQKLNELKDRVVFLESHLSWKEEFLSNRVLKKAVYKEFQEAAEIISDIIAMIVKDCNFSVEDDYKNIEIVSNFINIESIKNELKSINGLRNILVHPYGCESKMGYEVAHSIVVGNGVRGGGQRINDSLAYDSITSFLPAIKKFITLVEEWLRKRF